MGGRLRTNTWATRTVLASLGVLLLGVLVLITGADDVPAPLRAAAAGDLGAILTGPNGMTLYTYANDREPGKSVCTGTCAEKWPPFQLAPGAAAPAPPLGIIARIDGMKQYTYKGKPLYFCTTDKKPGDTSGHGFREFWSVARP